MMASDAIKYMQDNKWLPIIIVIVGLILLLLLIYLGIKLYRRCTRFDYTPLKEDLALPEKLSHARQLERNEVRENALLNFQYYLRSHSGKYTFSQHLPDMGSRVDKHWFLVRQHGRWKDLVVTQCSKSPVCPMAFNVSNQKTLRDILLAAEHPYVWPIRDINLWEEHDVVIATQDFNPSGSLKDYIYNVKPRHDWSNKYGMQSRGLPLKQIRLFGLQILKGMLYLQEMGFPPHGNLHAGNVIVKKGVCRVAGFENTFLGYTSKLYPTIRRLLKEKPEAIDTISFGHLLYEMGAGRELDEAVPRRAQLNRCQSPELIQLLEFIFDVAADYPTIANIAEHHFFAGIKLPELSKHPPKMVHLTSAMKSLIKAVKKGKVLRSRSSRSHIQTRTSFSKSKGKNSSKKTASNGISETATSVQAQTPVDPIPPPPPIIPPPLQSQPAAPPPPPPPTISFAPASNGSSSAREIPQVEGRGALLSDIRKGISLKKTVTNDKSNPKV